MTGREQSIYARGRRDGVAAAEERLQRRADFMATINSELLRSISGTLTDDQARAAELHERRIKGL